MNFLVADVEDATLNWLAGHGQKVVRRPDISLDECGATPNPILLTVVLPPPKLDARRTHSPKPIPGPLW